jgi:hypothetical protein
MYSSLCIVHIKHLLYRLRGRFVLERAPVRYVVQPPQMRHCLYFVAVQ